MVDVVFTDEPEEQQVEVFTDEPPAPSPRTTDAQADATALLGAISEIRNAPTDEPLSSIVNRNREMILSGQEDQMRSRHSQLRAVRRLEVNRDLQVSTMKYGQTGELPALVELDRTINSASGRYDLEKEAVEYLQNKAVEDSFQAILFENLMNQDDALDTSRDFAIKSAIFNRALAELQSEYEDQGLASKIGDFAISLAEIPFQSAGKVIGSTLKLETPAGTIKRKANNLWELPVAEFEAMLPEFMQEAKEKASIVGRDPARALELFSKFKGMSNRDSFGYNTWTYTDLTALPGVGYLGKKAIRIPQLLGNRAETVNMATDVLQGTKIPGVTDIDAVVESLPSGVLPDTPDLAHPYIGVSGDVSKRFETVTKVKEELNTAIVPDRLQPQQYEEAITSKIAELDNRFGDYNMVDFKLVDPQANVDAVGRYQLNIDPKTRVRQLSMYFGKRVGDGGYASEKSAKNAMRRMGLDPRGHDAVQGVDGQWFVKVTENVTETGIVTPELPLADLPLVGNIRKILTSADNISPEVFNEARHISETTRSRLQTHAFQPLQKIINATPSKDLKKVESVLALSEKESRWFKPEEIDHIYENTYGRLPTDKEVAAYYAAKDINDLHYEILNDATWTKRARLGFKTFQVKNKKSALDTGRQNAREVTEPTFGRIKVLDTEDNLVTSKGLKKKYEEGNYRLIELESALQHPETGEHYKYILAPKNDVLESPLHRQQVPYVPGGHRIYVDKWFVKQARSGVYQDGTKYWLNPFTHVVAKTKRQAREWAENWEQARQLYNSVAEGGEDIGNASARMEELTGVDFEKFSQLVKDGKIDPKHPFEVTYDRGLPDSMTGTITDDNLLLTDEWHDGIDGWMNTTGRLYYSPKGEHLPSVNEEFAEILSPFRTLEKSINNALNTAAMQNYQTFAVEEWARLARDYIEPDQFGPSPSAQRIFHDGKFKENFKINNRELHDALEAQRFTIRRFMGYQDSASQEVEVAARKLSGWIDSKTPEGKRLKTKIGRAASAASMDMHSSNPVAAIRGYTFDGFLGFYDPGQLFLQTQTAVAAISVEPINGARAAAMYWPNRLISINLKEPVLDYLAKNLKAIHGLDPQEYKAMMRSMIKSGEWDVSGELIQLSKYSTSLGGSSIRKNWDRFRSGGRWPFHEAERINRTVAWDIAWREVRKQNPDMDYNSLEFLGRVKQRAVDFGQNMRAASSASWQQGAFSIPTQFLSYQARILENILPKTFGGNPRFSAAQKQRLLLGQFLLYGTTGVPIVDYIADKWREIRGEDLSEDQWRALTKGFWDNLFYYGSGGKVDTDFASRAGQGEAWGDLIRDMFTIGFSTPGETVFGPTGSFIGSVGNSFKRIYQFAGAMRAEKTLDASSFGLIAQELGSNISSVRRTTKAMWILRTGRIIDPKTGQTVVEADKLEAIAAALGIPLAEEKDRWRMFSATKGREDEIKDMAGLVAAQKRRFFEAMQKGDEKEMDAAQRMVNGLMQAYRDDPLLKQQIIDQAVKNLGYTNSEYEYSRKKYEELLGRERR